MEKSLNFEIVKGTNLEKFYEYLKNDELIFNDKLNNSIIFIDCRKLIEYAIKEIIFFKNGLGAYEEANLRSLKGNIIFIKEMIPRSMYNKLEYIRFAGNKYAHEIEKTFDHVSCLKYTYEFVVWYLKNIEKKLPLDYDEDFKEPTEVNKNLNIKNEYKFNDEELLKELDEIKEKFEKTSKEREDKIKELEATLDEYKGKVEVLEEENSLALQKADPLIDIIRETIESNKNIIGNEEALINVIQTEDVIEGVKENLKELNNIIKVMNNEEKLYEMGNVQQIEDEYEYINLKLDSLSKDTLVLAYLLLTDLDDKKLVNKKGLGLNIFLNSKFRKFGNLTVDELKEGIKEKTLEFTKAKKFNGFNELLNKTHENIFKDKNEGGIYLKDILDIYVEELTEILSLKFKKSGSIKKVILFTKVIGGVSSEDTIVILNLMRKFYSKEDINVDALMQLDVESLEGLLKEAKSLTEYIVLSKFIITLIDGLKYKRIKVFKEILEKLKGKNIKEEEINLILFFASISLY